MSKQKTKGAQLRDVNYLFDGSCDEVAVGVMGNQHIHSENNEMDTSGNVRIGEIVDLPISKLVDFENHPFYVEDDQSMMDLVASVESNGVMNAVLVRPAKDFAETGNYEKLAGHRRTRASFLAGKVTIPARILHNITDDEAMAIVIETNLMQRSFNDLLPTEKARVVGIQHTKMFSQGKRNDILRMVAESDGIEFPKGEEFADRNTDITIKNGSNDTPAQFEPKSEKTNTNKKIADTYGLSEANVKRWVRIANHLTPELKKHMDNNETGLGITTAEAVSHLTKNEQEILADCLSNHPYSVDIKKAGLMREYSDKEKLNENTMMLILTGKAIPRKEAEVKTKINPELFKKYFTKEQTNEEIDGILDKALKLYFTNNPTL